MPDEVNNQTGRITTQQFYEALLQIKDDISSMERRISEKIDCIPGYGIQIIDLKDEVKDLRRKSYVWDGINSVGVIIGTIVGSIFKPQ